MADHSSNLIPVRRGEVRNPNGRPKGGQNFETVIKKFLQINQKGPDPFSQETDPKKKPIISLTIMEQIVLAQVQKALTGDTTAAEWVAARGFGKMIQQTALSVNASHNLRYENLESTEDMLTALREIEEEEKALDIEYGRSAEKVDFEEI